MCDYCDCRQQEPIARLSEEHDRLLALSVRIRAALGRHDTGAAASGLADLMTILEPHAQREERALFVAHIDREEHDVFPAASQLLSAGAWAVIIENSQSAPDRLRTEGT